MEVQAETAAGFDVQDLPRIAGRMSPDQLVAPRLLRQLRGLTRSRAHGTGFVTLDRHAAVLHPKSPANVPTSAPGSGSWIGRGPELTLTRTARHVPVLG